MIEYGKSVYGFDLGTLLKSLLGIGLNLEYLHIAHCRD